MPGGCVIMKNADANPGPDCFKLADDARAFQPSGRYSLERLIIIECRTVDQVGNIGNQGLAAKVGYGMDRLVKSRF